MTSLKNILIVRTDRIGDVILTLPLASILKKHFPNSKITFLLRQYTKPLAVNNIYIDEVITLEKDLINLNFFERIKNFKKFDLAIIAYPTFSIAVMLFFSGIKIRIGTGYRWYSFLFNRKIFEHRKDAKFHELEYNVHLLKAIRINEEINPINVDFSLQSSPKTRQNIIEELQKVNVDLKKKIIIIHPGSGGSSIDLPISSMKKLVEKLAYDLDIEILITGNEDDKELCEMLVVNEKTKNLAGKFNLENFVAIVEKADLLIANSTGPVHIAAALNKSVIGFYPKVLVCSDKRWGPYTEKKKIFTPKIDCDNCTIEQCKKINCMATIDIDDVFNSVKNILDIKEPEINENFKLQPEQNVQNK
jgi:lipopolysaccharide heptosyltransferase II